MKTRYIILSAAAIMSAAACNKAANTNDVEVKGNRVQDTITLKAPATKTALGEDDTVAWKAGDTVVYFSNEGTAEEGYEKHNILFTEDCKNAEVTLQRYENENFYVLCYAGIPSNEMSLTSHTIASFTPRNVLKASQTGEFRNANVCAGYIDLTKAEKPYSITMQNVTSLVEFSTSGQGIKKVEFMGNNSEGINGGDTNGRIVVDLTKEKFSAVKYGAQASAVSNITKDEEMDGTYYFSVFPQTFTKGFSLKMYKNPDHKYTYSKVGTTAEKEFVAGTIYGLGSPFKAEKYGIDMTTAEMMAANGIDAGAFTDKLILDDVTISAPKKQGATSDQGSYTTQWRLYQARGTELTVSTSVGKIKSICFTFTNQNNGCLFAAGDESKTPITTGTLVDNIHAASKSFVIGSTVSTTTTAQVRITNVKIILED